TDGVINPRHIALKAGVIKATYMSHVGQRQLPTVMDEALAGRIREDAHEYGATTRRPRGIAHLDLPALTFYSQVGQLNCLVLTHMDIVYPEVPIKVCTEYRHQRQAVAYRPDQVFLNTVTPVYQEFKAWETTKIRSANSYSQLPSAAKTYLSF